MVNCESIDNLSWPRVMLEKLVLILYNLNLGDFYGKIAKNHSQ